ENGHLKEIANLRVTSLQKIAAYNDHIFHYAKNCLQLYPDEQLKPNLHTALHIGDFMRLFSPVHAYSTPFYEQYINFFHRINTNKKIGELECTLMQTATHACNLRALLAEDTDLRSTAVEMIKEIDATNTENAHGFHLASLLDPTASDFVLDSNATSIELAEGALQHLHALISTNHPNGQARISCQALAVNEISIHSVTYGTSTSSKSRNSNILFQRTINGRDKLFAGIIEGIFQYTYEVVNRGPQKDLCLSVWELTSVDTSLDPYLVFGLAGGFLCIPPHAGSHIFAINLSQVISHVALTPMIDSENAGKIHVLPVDR
ncbi:hypothetical protein C0995_012348, partial [Termitomyces sp. Mi166